MCVPQEMEKEVIKSVHEAVSKTIQLNGTTIESLYNIFPNFNKKTLKVAVRYKGEYMIHPNGEITQQYVNATTFLFVAGAVSAVLSVYFIK